MRTLFKLGMVLFLLGAVFYAVVAVLDPWALHIGDRTTPLLSWHGDGTLVAKDGKTYLLYVYLHPGGHASRLRMNGLRSNSGVSGSAELCTAPGATQLLTLSGSMYGGHSGTDGS